MATLKLMVLGPPSVEVDGVRVTLGRKKALGLLVYLGATGLRHSRDSLAHLLFPRYGRTRAFSDLRQTLSVLKSTIGPGWLEVGRDEVALAERPGMWIDLREFRRLAACGEEAELAQAAVMVRGPFLSEFYLPDSRVFEEWQAAETEAIQREHAAVLARILDLLQGRADYPGAIDVGGRLLELDPLDEAAHRRMMRLYAAAGQRAAAARQYEACRTILRSELGQSPDPETDELRDRILAGAYPGQPAAIANGRTGKGPPAYLAVRNEKHDGQEASVTAFPSLEPALAEALHIQRLSSRSAQVGVHVEADRIAERTPADSAEDRALMIARAAAPGAILLSESAARHAIGAPLPRLSSVRPLGSHRLDDLGPAAALFHLVHPDLEPVPAAPRGLDSVRNNLRSQPTRFIGRRKELETAAALLCRDDVRLLTFTGPGGTGKTRLAQQIAARVSREFGDGVFFVDLSAARSASGAAAAICSGLGIVETLAGAVIALEDHLRPRRTLLVLDNFEQLLPDGSGLAAELISVCPALKLVVTSRAALNVRAEHEVRIDPLPVPILPAAAADSGTPEDAALDGVTLDGAADLAAVVACESVALFADRAAHVRPGFAVDAGNAVLVTRICRRLDGLPLAIELAAGRLHDLDTAALARGVGGGLVLLTEGPRDLPERQRTLRGELDWSYELLDDGERRLFRRLGVFSGGWDADSASAVCADPGMDGNDGVTRDRLSALVGKSMVLGWETGLGVGYRLLETIREYALERLGLCGETQAATIRLADFAVDLAERVEPSLFGAGVAAGLDRLELHLDSIRFALGWLQDSGRLDSGSRLAAAMGWFWFRRARFAEGRQWLERYEAAAAGTPSARARIAYYLGWMEISAGNFFLGNPRALHWFRESLERFRLADDSRGVALSLVWIGLMSLDLPTPERHRLCDQGIAAAREAADPWTLALCLKIGCTYLPRQDTDPARKVALAAEAIALARAAGDPYLVAETTHGMGDVYYFLDDHASAEAWFRESLEQARESGFKWLVCDNLWQLADGCVARGRLPDGKALYREGLRLAESIGDRGHYSWFLRGLAWVSKCEGRAERCLRLTGAADALEGARAAFPPSAGGAAGADDARAAALWNEGRLMSTSAVIAQALSDDGALDLPPVPGHSASGQPHPTVLADA